jgi:hypothetical protein
MFDFLLLLTLISTITNCSNINFQSTMKKRKKLKFYSSKYINKKNSETLIKDFTECFDNLPQQTQQSQALQHNHQKCTNRRDIDTIGINNAKDYIIEFHKKYVNKETDSIFTQEVPYKYIKNMATKKWGEEKFKKDNPEIKDYNVISTIKSKNPVAKYIVFSAHYDHCDGNPGADDNASGVIALLKMSEIIQKMENKKPFLNFNIIFLYCTAEERGLIGSKYFVENLPTINKKKLKLSDILLNINIDMLGRNCSIKDSSSNCPDKKKTFLILAGNIIKDYETTCNHVWKKKVWIYNNFLDWEKLTVKEELELYHGENKEAQKKFVKILNKIVLYTEQANEELGDLLEEINSTQHQIRNSDPKAMWAYRSDSANFYAKGIPAIFFSGGDHPDYHQPTDTYEKIKYDIFNKRIKVILKTFELLNNDKELIEM